MKITMKEKRVLALKKQKHFKWFGYVIKRGHVTATGNLTCRTGRRRPREIMLDSLSTWREGKSVSEMTFTTETEGWGQSGSD